MGIADVQTIDQALAGAPRFYLNAAAAATQEAICEVVACPMCGATAGEYCISRRGKRAASGGGRHADRCTAARVWRKQHPAEWKELKDAIFRVIIKARR